MQPRTVKKIFIFFLIYLPLQYGLVGVGSLMKTEPWPAFVLPAFKSVFTTDQTLAVDQLQLYMKDNKNDRLIEIAPDDLFADIPRSQRQGFFRTHLRDSAAAAAWSDDARRWIAARLPSTAVTGPYQSLRVRWVRRYYRASGMDTARVSTETLTQFGIEL